MAGVLEAAESGGEPPVCNSSAEGWLFMHLPRADPVCWCI